MWHFCSRFWNVHSFDLMASQGLKLQQSCTTTLYFMYWILNYIELSLLLLSIIWKLRTYLLIIISLSVLSSTKVFSNHYYFFKQNCKLRFLNLSLSFYLPRELHHFWQMSNMPNMLHISTLNLFSYFNRMFLIVLDDIISYVLHTDSKCLIKNIRLPFCCIFHFS